MTADKPGQRPAAASGPDAVRVGSPHPPDPLARAARRAGAADALDGPGGRRSYADLDAAATEVADLVRQAASPGGDGVGPVAFLLPRGAAAVACLHAIPRAGAAAAPLHPGWTESELEAYLARLAPSVLVCDGRTRERAEAVRPPGSALLELSEAWPPAAGAAALRAASAASPVLPATADSRGAGWRGGGTARLHTVLATSGSSGAPKAAGLTLDNHVACARATERRMLLGPADRWLASLSPAHVGGVALVMRAAWTGAALVLREGFDAEEVAALVDAGAVTHASLVPAMLSRLLEVRATRPAPLTLRGLLLGGDAAVPERVARALELGYPLFPTYGLTEAASQVATARPEEARRWPGTVGRPLDGTEIRIAENDEILVRGPTVMAGYVLGPGSPEGAAERDGPAAPSLGADGWLRTGDAGRMDGEGRLWVTGRLSLRIVSGGVTVDPAEVEAALRSHPDVREVTVVGLPDAEWGERVAAAVVPASPGPLQEEEARRLEEALGSLCRERLAPAKRPRRIRVLPELPRNPNGKVDRAALRSLLG
jgi:O-succinylbenzoic acid--CoA ligase